MKRVSKSVESTQNNKHSEMIDNVRSLIISHRLCGYADHVVIGFSGGPDSMALLHVLLSLRHELGLKVSAAHFNHRIRSGADQDEAFVKKYAKKLQLNLYCQKASCHPPQKGSLEEWARKERYRFFQKALLHFNADRIALGHTADDLAETVLMRILRGAGLQGLIGMEATRVIDDLLVIRPFLGIYKEQVMNYLTAEKIPYCIDETNQQTDFLRNKIRLELMPYLVKEYNPHIKRTLVNLSNTASVDYAFLEKCARTVWDADVQIHSGRVEINITKVSVWSSAIRRMIIRMAYEAVKGDLNQLTFEHILSVENVMMSQAQIVKLPTNISVKRDKRSICFLKAK